MKTKKKSLTFIDRLLLPTLLPKNGSFTDMIVSGDIVNKLRLTQKELVDYQISVTPDGRTNWDNTTTPEKFDYAFTSLEENVIIASLNKLDETNTVELSHLNLYRTFILNKKTPFPDENAE